MKELTIHSYNTRLKETCNIHSMKDVLMDLQENNLYSLEAYIRAINAVVEVPSMQQYIEREYIVPIVADWPVHIYLITVIYVIMSHQTLLIIYCLFFPSFGPLHISLNRYSFNIIHFLQLCTSLFLENRSILHKNPSHVISIF